MAGQSVQWVSYNASAVKSYKTTNNLHT
jgi:hypothetical protein